MYDAKGLQGALDFVIYGLVLSVIWLGNGVGSFGALIASLSLCLGSGGMASDHRAITICNCLYQFTVHNQLSRLPSLDFLVFSLPCWQCALSAKRGKPSIFIPLNHKDS